MNKAVNVAFPETEYQKCIVYQVRNTLKYVSYKDKKSFATYLNSIYQAPSEQIAYERMLEVTDKWGSLYPNAMKSWSVN